MSARRAGVVGAALLLAACGREPHMEPGAPIPRPAEAGVEHVVFIVGDPGKAIPETHPILTNLRDEVEHWSAALGRDSAVVVVVVGDIIYPNGMHARDDREDFPHDSVMVTGQLGVISGPAARAHHTPMYFLAGNHDWGKEQHEEGVSTLQNLDDFLAAQRPLGLNTRLLPAAGEPGPAVVDLGPWLRFIFLDTAWWLLQSRGTEGARMISGIEGAMRTAGDRHVVILGHHPYISGGPHGGALPLVEGLGIGFLLKRSGAILQDLNSPPYRRLRAEMGRLFRDVRQPLLWAAGHEHSLQLIEADRTDEPRWSMVSGSASKITHVETTPGMRYRMSAPGYFILIARTDGSVETVAVAAPVEEADCTEAPDRAACMAAGVDAFQPRFQQRLTD